jgi:hypothetical protein
LEIKYVHSKLINNLGIGNTNIVPHFPNDSPFTVLVIQI